MPESPSDLVQTAPRATTIGTDGPASNADMDMLAAIRQSVIFQKYEQQNPEALPGDTALRMATIGGARALRKDAEIGSLEAGKRADIIVVGMSSARQTPMYNPVSHLVYTTHGDDVRTTIVNGRVLMRDRRMLTLDEAAVLAEARRWAVEIRKFVSP